MDPTWDGSQITSHFLGGGGGGGGEKKIGEAKKERAPVKGVKKKKCKKKKTAKINNRDGTQIKTNLFFWGGGSTKILTSTKMMTSLTL